MPRRPHALYPRWAGKAGSARRCRKSATRYRVFLVSAGPPSRVLIDPGRDRLRRRFGAHSRGDGRVAQSRRRGTAKEVCEGPESGRAAARHQPCRPCALHCDRYGWTRRASRERRNTRRDEADRRFSIELNWTSVEAEKTALLILYRLCTRYLFLVLFEDFSDFLESISCETPKTCQVRGSSPCRGATPFAAIV